MSEHWCTYCQGANAHNCQFNANVPRQHIYMTNSTAHPVQAEAALPGYVADKSFRWDGEKQQHIPLLVIEFEPVPANSPCDAKGWKDRDQVAQMFDADLAQQKRNHVDN